MNSREKWVFLVFIKTGAHQKPSLPEPGDEAVANARGVIGIAGQFPLQGLVFKRCSDNPEIAIAA